jgi:hypothetical protein
MAIARIQGDMLETVLNRTTGDFMFTAGNDQTTPILYFDTVYKQVGIKNLGGSQTLTVSGNVSAGNVIITGNGTTGSDSLIQSFNNDGNITIKSNGTGNVKIFNANIQSGLIDNANIGTTTPGLGSFTALNSTRLLAGSGRVLFTDSVGIIDNDDFRYFTANNTLVAGNIVSKSGTVGFNAVTVNTLTVSSALVNGVGYFDASNNLVTKANLEFFSSNNTLLASNVKLTDVTNGRLVYVDTNNNLATSSYLAFDGFNITATGLTTLGTVTLSGQTISTSVTNQDLIVAPNGTGRVSVQNHTITDVPTPVNPSDAVNKAYVDGQIQVSNSYSIYQLNSKVQVSDNGFQYNVQVVLNNVVSATFTDIYANIQGVTLHNNTIGTINGRLSLVPYNNDKVSVTTNSAITLPVGQTSSRPLFPDVGDMRYNSQVSNIEFYDGTGWKQPQVDSTLITSQIIVPTGVDYVYTLNHSATTTSVLISINGVTQQPGTSYSVSGTTLTLVTLHPPSDIIEVRFLAAALAEGANPTIINDAYTTVGTSTTQMDSFYALYYRAARYTYVAKSDSGSKYETGDINLIHDGVTPYFNVRRVGTASNWLTWSAAIDIYGVLSISASSTNSDTKVKMQKTYFNDQV